MIPPSTALIPSRSLDRLLAEIQFLQSAARFKELPAPEVPEVAFAGRSNAGKSTALNVLVNRRRLAFASKTPGRTRLINLFALTDPDGEVGRLVDLPGYGYAAVDATTQRLWKAELSKYLGERQNLAGLILVTDIRHALGPLDQQLLAWFAPRELPIHVLLTKADKLNRREQNRAMSKVATFLDAHPSRSPEIRWSHSCFSGLKRTGKEQVLDVMASWLGLGRPGLAQTPSGPHVTGSAT
jgi:GTP-binding protein